MFEQFEVEAVLTAEGWVWHLNDAATGVLFLSSIATFATAERAHQMGEEHRQLIKESQAEARSQNTD